MNNTAKNYVSDLAPLILERANKAKQSGQSGNDLFEQGRLSAFYEVLSLMKQQAFAFGLGDEMIGLKGVNLEDLLARQP